MLQLLTFVMAMVVANADNLRRNLAGDADVPRGGSPTKFDESYGNWVFVCIIFAFGSMICGFAWERCSKAKKASARQALASKK